MPDLASRDCAGHPVSATLSMLAPLGRVTSGVSSDASLAQMTAHFGIMEPIFDALNDIVFFVKDHEARYVMINQTLAQRCGYARQKAALIGRRATEVFPERVGKVYTEQDEQIIRDGARVIDQLELLLYPGRLPGWCLTSKLSLTDAAGQVVGLVGISRDLQAPEASHPVYKRLANAACFIQENYARPLRLPDVAKRIDMSVAQIERYFHKVFHLTPRQMLLKVRLDAAAAMLAGEASITDVATRCGYTDHSAFTRQFKATVGMTPTHYRTLVQSRLTGNDRPASGAAGAASVASTAVTASTTSKVSLPPLPASSVFTYALVG